MILLQEHFASIIGHSRERRLPATQGEAPDSRVQDTIHETLRDVTDTVQPKGAAGVIPLRQALRWEGTTTRETSFPGGKVSEVYGHPRTNYHVVAGLSNRTLLSWGEEEGAQVFSPKGDRLPLAGYELAVDSESLKLRDKGNTRPGLEVENNGHIAVPFSPPTRRSNEAYQFNLRPDGTVKLQQMRYGGELPDVRVADAAVSPSGHLTGAMDGKTYTVEPPIPLHLLPGWETIRTSTQG